MWVHRNFTEILGTSHSLIWQSAGLRTPDPLQAVHTKVP